MELKRKLYPGTRLAHAKATCAFVASLSLDCSAICCPLSLDCIATAMALMPMMAWWGPSGNSVQALACRVSICHKKTSAHKEDLVFLPMMTWWGPILFRHFLADFAFVTKSWQCICKRSGPLEKFWGKRRNCFLSLSKHTMRLEANQIYLHHSTSHF